MFVPTFLDKFLPRKMGNVYILSSKNRIVLGPHWPGVLVTLALIAGGTNLNLQVIDTKYPIASATNASMKVLVFFFCTTTLLLFLKTACTEAGIITGVSPTSHQQLHDTESHDDGSITPHLSTHTSHSTHTAHSLVTSPSPSTPLELLVFCDICETYSLDSQNARHCPDCNVCLEQMDHHWYVTHPHPIP